MNELKEPSNKQKADANERNKVYVLTDVVGKKHFLIAGENDLTEEWIAEIRHDENVIRSSDFHFYYRWNGKHYTRRVFHMDSVPMDEMEHYPSITASKDALTTLIEAREQVAFDQKYKAAMDSLTDQQWRLVYKRFELKMSDTEIAEEEGVSKMAISKHWDRIQTKINKFFTK